MKEHFLGEIMKHLILVLSLLISSVAFGRDGSSGCGPGWYVFQDNSIISSALRATTNAFFFPTTTIGMTLGTSNCTQHKLVLNEKRSLHFVTHNLYELKSQAAQGEGDYLQAFAEVVGCQKNQTDLLKKTIQSNHQNVFENSAPEKVLEQVFIQILRSPELSQSCSLS